MSEINEKRIRINEKRREQRRRKIEEDPEYLTKESEKRKERRRKNAEMHKQNPESLNRQIISEAADRLYEQNKHTFPNPVSKTKFNNMKEKYLDFLFSKEFSPGENTLNVLMEDRKMDIKSLQQDPNYPCAASILFFIKTLVPFPKDNARKLTQSEIGWINSLDTSSSPEKIKKSYGQKEYKREKSKQYYENSKMEQKMENLNMRFIKADPNRVLSIDEIINDPFVSNFSQRERHKIELWKADGSLEDLEKWRKQYEDYVLKVKELSIEYKEAFLKNKK